MDDKRPKPERGERLAAALRANLARRKAQARERAGDGGDAGDNGDEAGRRER